MLEEKMKHFKSHFKKYKNAYFQNRGFVTFKTFKIAHEVKEIYNKAIRDEKDNFIYNLKSWVMNKIEKKTKLEKESKAKHKFRNIVLNKVMKKKTEENLSEPRDRGKKLTGFLAKATNLISGASDQKMKNKVELMKKSVGPKVKKLKIDYSL